MEFTAFARWPWKSGKVETQHFDATRIAIIYFKHLSTSRKKTVDTFCLRCWNGTFDIILRPHIVRGTFSFSIARFPAVRFLFNSTSVTAVNQHYTWNNTVQLGGRTRAGIFPSASSRNGRRGGWRGAKGVNRRDEIEMLTNLLCIAGCKEQIFHESSISIIFLSNFDVVAIDSMNKLSD